MRVYTENICIIGITETQNGSHCSSQQIIVLFSLCFSMLVLLLHQFSQIRICTTGDVLFMSSVVRMPSLLVYINNIH